MHVYHEFCHKLRIDNGIKTSILDFEFSRIALLSVFWLQLFNVNKPIAEK
jgi:hypothetical protein